MTGPDRREVERLFHLLADCPPEERAAFWERQPVEDELRRRVEQLLELDGGNPEALLAPPPAPVPLQELKRGDRLGPYVLRELIGEGGMGEVYLARQEAPVRREVALKIVKLGMDTRQVVARFEAERQTLASMNHPHIARMYDAGAGPSGRPYFVMEYVAGRPLTVYADQERLGLEARLELFLQACDAVQSAHQHGVIHRDLKPMNLLVTEVDGEPFLKVIDFGVAKISGQAAGTLLTSHGELVGTPEYMSPEQTGLDPADVDTTSDIYSLGVILFELLTGMLPFDFAALRQGGLLEIQRTLREVDPPRASARLAAGGAAAEAAAALRGCTASELRLRLRSELDWIAMKAMSRSRSERYATASELAADIRRHLDGEEVLARASTMTYRLRKTLRRHRVAATWMAVILLTLVAGIVGSTRFALEARNAQRAQEQATLLAEDRGRAAEASRRLAEETSYTATLQAAARALEDGQVADAEHLLEDSPAALRGWEWRHLRARLDESEREFEVPAGRGFVSHQGQIDVDEGSGEIRALLSDPSGIVAWDLTTGGVRWQRSLPAAAAAFAAGGASVIYQDPPGTVIRERTEDGGERRVVVSLPGRPECLAQTVMDGPELLVLSCDDGGREFRLLVDLVSGDTRPIRGLQLAVAPGRMAMAFHNGVFLQRRPGEAPGELPGPEAVPNGVLFADGGRRLFGSSWGGELVAWDADRGEQLWRTDHAHRGAILGMDVDPVGGRVATAGADHSIRLWDEASGELLQELSGHREQVIEVAFLAGGKRMVSRSTTEIRLWRTPARERQERGVTVLRGHSRHVYPVAFTADGDRLLSGGWDGRLRVWAGGRIEGTVEFDHGTLSVVRSLAVAPDGRTAFAGVTGGGTPGQLFAVDLLDGEARALGEGRVRHLPAALAHDPLRSVLASVWFAYDGTSVLEVRETGSGQLLLERERLRRNGTAPGAVEFIQAVAYSPDGGWLAAALGDEELLLYDAATLEVRRTVDLGGARVSALAFSPDSRQLAVARDDPAVVVYDVESGSELAVMTGHRAQIFSVAWSPDGSRIASGADDRTVRIWDSRTWHDLLELRGHDSYVYSVAFSPDGSRLASGSGDGTVRLWDTRPARERYPENPSTVLRAAAAPWTRRITAGLFVGDAGNTPAALPPELATPQPRTAATASSHER